MADEAPVLQQYSKQLNVYNADESERGRLLVNTDDYFEVNYKAGLGPVLLKNVWYQAEALAPLHNLDQEIFDVNNAIQTEATRATAAEGVLTAAVVTEQTRATAEEKKNSDGLASEVSARTSAVTSVASSIATEVAARISDVSTLTNSIANEATARGAADGVHTSAIAVVSAAITSEAKRADDEEKRIVGLISAEVTSRASADSIIVTSVSAFNNRAFTAEAALQTALNAEVTARGLALDQSYTSLAADLTFVNQRAIAAELALSDRIDNVLSNITPEAIDSFTEVVTALGAGGVGGLAGSINNEATRALAIEGSLQTQINALLAAVLALQAPY